MKRVKISGLFLLLALAVNAAGAAVAPAATHSLPEVGRCGKVATGAGAYTTATCVKKATNGLGKYEWTPVSATEKQTFSGAGGEISLATTGHQTIRCVAANFSGEYTGPKTATVQIEFQACTNPQEQQCQSISPQNKSEIATLPLEGELGFVRNQTIEGRTFITVGMDLKPQPPLHELMSYECSGSTEVSHVEGSVIARLRPFDKMTTESNLQYLVKKTVGQIPEQFEGGPKDTLSTTFTSGLETLGTAPSTLNIVGYIGHNTNPLEIKAKES
jgi:hypothetical protein